MSAEERIRKALHLLDEYVSAWEGDRPLTPERGSKDAAVAAHAALDEMCEELHTLRKAAAKYAEEGARLLAFRDTVLAWVNETDNGRLFLARTHRVMVAIAREKEEAANAD